MPSAPRLKPELLAPAGDRTCLIAAVENGADAVYFGLQRHNARIRANNFDGADLPEVMALLHRRGVKGYVTLNTLVFPGELPDLEATVRDLAAAGVDAVIVQDLGLVRLIRAITPDLEIHASTQMSITSEEGSRAGPRAGLLARDPGPRAVARRDRPHPRRGSTCRVEVFVHGALCVAYSGQCLTSEALGGRSANRGECAQACRMPYQIVCDGQLVDLGERPVPPESAGPGGLRPDPAPDRAGSRQPEDRGPAQDRRVRGQHHAALSQAIDAAWAGRPVAFTPRDVQEMQLSFSRGFSHGFLDGNNHKVLVRGDYAKKRGIFAWRRGIDHRGRGLARVRDDRQARRRPGLRRRRRDRARRARWADLRSHSARSRALAASSLAIPARRARFGRERFDLRALEASGSGRPTIPS